MLRDLEKLRAELGDSVRPVADQMPTTWAAGVSYCLDAVERRQHDRFETCSTFDLADVRRVLNAVARVRAKLGGIPAGKGEVEPPSELSADAKALHLARVLTPAGWELSTRTALMALKQAVFDRFLAQRYDEPAPETKKRGRPPKETPKAETLTDGDLQAEYQVYRDLVIQLDQIHKNGEMANARLLRALPGRLVANGR